MTEFNPGAAGSLNAAVKLRYEANADTNAFTDAEQAKLAGIETGAEVNYTAAELVAALDAELASTDWQTGGGTPAWGAVTGTLSDQTDLQTALDAKAPTTRTISAGTGLTGGGSLAANRTLSVDFATPEEVFAGTSAAKSISPDAALDAGAPVALTDGFTITPDFAAGRVFSVTLGGNRSLAAPSNQAAGQSGMIIITQDGTGSRTLTFDSAYKFESGYKTLSTAAGAIDVVSYYVQASGTILCSLGKGFA